MDKIHLTKKFYNNLAIGIACKIVCSCENEIGKINSLLKTGQIKFVD